MHNIRCWDFSPGISSCCCGGAHEDLTPRRGVTVAGMSNSALTPLTIWSVVNSGNTQLLDTLMV